MNHPATQCIALIGPSGSGKSSTGSKLAQVLGWQFRDLDTLIETRSGMTISEIFDQEGEAGFRERESMALVEALDTKPVVIACGGGVILRQFNRTLLREQTWCVYLTAQHDVLLQRLEQDPDQPRPLLNNDARERLALMLTERRPLYASLAQWTVHTDHLAPSTIVHNIVYAWHLAEQSQTTTVISHSQRAYMLKAMSFDTLPIELHTLGLNGACWLVSDERVGPIYAPAIQASLEAADLRCETFFIPATEQSKSLETANTVYTWLLEHGVQRGDTLIALGGGVVGDLAGFVAATMLRGIALVQIPTTILSMIDSSIGGKTGVNHALGKNLIGAFYPPRLIVINHAVLETLPRRERAAGWAETVKHGVIADAALFADLERAGATLNDLPADITSDLLVRSAMVKIGVVNRDEYETGERLLLNYGHTLGHALENIMGYGQYLHGEAVAIGMTFAAELAVRREAWSADEARRQTTLLQALELPTQLPPTVDVDRLLNAMMLDKKRANNTIRWVLPTQIGKAMVDRTVPLDLVRDLLVELVPSSHHG